MSEEVKNVITDEQIAEAVKRVGELAKTRQEINTYKSELLTHQEDLENAKKVFGVGSSEYELQKGHVENKTSLIEEAEKKVAELSYKRSELKPILDALAKKFEEAYKADTSKEHHIQVYPKPEKKDEPINPNKGKKVFRQLMDYLYHNVGFTAKSAASLMVLVLNMEDNKPWVNSKAFDNHIILRSASVLSLYRCIMEVFHGTGFYEARTFLECWANCGQSVSEAVRQIQKDNAKTRQIGTDLNAVEDEFNLSENDLPEDEGQISTQEEVAPEVSE
jgi:hypothetical protein